jgi:hypothetical protein
VVETRFIGGKSIHDYFWTADNQTLVYAQAEKCPTGCKTTWYRFDLASGVTTTFKSEIVTIDPEVWKRLTNLQNPPEITPRKDPNVSPSGEWVIYSRMSPSYTPPPCPKGPCLPPMELWLARVDGSKSAKISDLGRGIGCGALGWFDSERKALLSCGYEGPVHFVVADLQKSTLIEFDEIAKQHVITLGSATLSRDGERLAVDNILTQSVELQVIPLNGSAIVNLGLRAEAPQWSADGQRLYYEQRVTPDKCTPAAIHVYDFAANQDRIMLGPEVVLSPTQRVTLDACHHTFLVSPAEDAILLGLDESGSWIVGLALSSECASRYHFSLITRHSSHRTCPEGMGAGVAKHPCGTPYVAPRPSINLRYTSALDVAWRVNCGSFCRSM